MANVYQVGETVKLKAGGPDMSVKQIHGPTAHNGEVTTYRCQWFAGKKLEEGVFPGDSLQAVPAAATVTGN